MHKAILMKNYKETRLLKNLKSRCQMLINLKNDY